MYLVSQDTKTHFSGEKKMMCYFKLSRQDVHKIFNIVFCFLKLNIYLMIMC